MHDEIEVWLKGLGRIAEKSIGYPLSKSLEHAWLPLLLQFPLNNLGDPYIDGTYSLNSKKFERKVIEFLSQQFRAPAGTWGYVTSCGSEGNLFGLYAARKYLPTAPVFMSDATHYSLAKACDLLRMQAICVRSTWQGEIDYADLSDKLRDNAHGSAIVVANAGTTMHEARDDVPTIRSLLALHGVQLAHVHVDAALAGAYLPFMAPHHCFDFQDGADSISVSGHKFFGSPVPCGAVLVREERKALVGKDVAYLGSVDSTIGGSRNAIAPAILWALISELGCDGLAARYRECENLASALVEALVGIGINAWKHPGALTVVMPRVSDALIARWDLASDQQWSHVIVMPGIIWTTLEAFIEDVRGEQSDSMAELDYRKLLPHR